MDDGDRNGGADGSHIVEQLPADAAFELLGNERRLAILRALFDADGPVAFSTLRERVGTRDSGQFNYHLDKLLGTFVRKDDEEYELTPSGVDVVGSVLAGRYTKSMAGDPVAVAADCPDCGRSLVGHFDEDHVKIACDGCDRDVINLNVPPGAFEPYDRDDWPLVAERWTRQEFATVTHGFCWACHGPLDERVETETDAISDVFAASVRYVCDRCGEELCANVEASLVTHPAVIAFHHERGVDVTTTPIWELAWAVEPVATVVATDPIRVEVPITCDGDELVVTVDENADVVATD